MPQSKKDKQVEVLAELKQHGNISRAARATGVPRRTINNWRRDDYEFGAACRRALKVGRI